MLNELDEYAVEEALRIAESRADGSTVTRAVDGPAARGRDVAQGAVDGRPGCRAPASTTALEGTDAVGTSYALAQALGTLPYDLVLLGSESTDARMSVVPAMLAERLGQSPS